MRVSAGNWYEFLINHSDEDQHVVVAPAGFDLLSERDVDGKVTLPPMGVAIVRRRLTGGVRRICLKTGKTTPSGTGPGSLPGRLSSFS